MDEPADSQFPNEVEALRGLLSRERARHAAVLATKEAALAEREATLAGLAATVERQRRTIESLEQRLAKLLKRTYGPRSEKLDPDQLLLFDDAALEALAAELAADAVEEANEEADGAAPDASLSKTSRAGHGRRALPAHLPRETRRHELPAAERACPCCGEARVEIGAETSEQLEYVPASYKIIEHVRVKYACRSCEEHVALAAKPPQPIDKGLPGPGLLAQTVLSKYGDHAPLYRQEDIAARHGLVIRRSTLCDWVAAAADLAEPLYHRMADFVKQSRVLHTDDTTVRMLDPLSDEARTARFWAYVGDAAHPYSVYDFTDSRKRDGPEKFLSGYRGYLQADAYGGYDGIFLHSRGAVVEVACWAHARRHWHDARTADPVRADTALGFIGRLYQIEQRARDVSAADRRRLREEHSLGILHSFRTWLDGQAFRALPKSPAGQAIGYTLNQWEALVRYTEDGALAIDNNLSERTVKPCAVGRKNWLFVGSRAGGRRAAILFSLVASAKANQVEPWAWLRDVFTRLPAIAEDATSPAAPAPAPEPALDRTSLANDPAAPAPPRPSASPAPNPLDALLPDRWLAANPSHRWDIDALRRRERRRSQPLRDKNRRR